MALSLPAKQRGILTPKESGKPAIHSPTRYGVHPGHPVLYRIPASGQRPMQFSADRLPPGLTLDAHTGIIKGQGLSQGTYSITLRATNSRGTAQKPFRIVAGDMLALTPPMGWSTWYMAFADISDHLVRAQAAAMISSGLANHGYSYIDIDDGWNTKLAKEGISGGEAGRDASGNQKPNSQFPDMKALADYVHGLGLKIGIYTSPGLRTCGGYEGSYGHEAQDADLFAQWGFDLLKYDMCSYGRMIKDRNNAAEVSKPYRLMGRQLRRQKRDMMYNLCEYGWANVPTWGKAVGGNFWRTAGDVGAAKNGLWESMSRIGFGQAGKEKWAGPGGWNDPDNILIGDIIWKKQLVPTPLTHNEQYTYMTLWSLLDAPLVFGGDMTKLDDFTLSLLTNDEVIGVNQDFLGKQAAPVYRSGDIEIWMKDLDGGAKAMGIFNRGENEKTVRVPWSQVGLKGQWQIRDLWRQRDLGRADSKFGISVGEHGAALLALKART